MGKKLGVGIIALLFLFVGAGGYFSLAGQGADGEREQTTAPRVVPEFVPMEPITLPVLRGDRVRRLVGFRIVLELAPGATRNAVLKRLPRVEDAFVTELAALLALEWPGGEPIDMAVAKSRLIEQSDRVIGNGVVARVLFEQVQVRAL